MCPITRDLYLLELVLTNVEALWKTKVLTKRADHNLVQKTMRVTVTGNVRKKRIAWQYGTAKWDKMKQRINSMD